MPKSALAPTFAFLPDEGSTIVNYDMPNRKDWNGLALIGEAPGREEVKLGHPFVGRSGQLLNEILIKAGIERQRSIVANVFRLQPPGNKVDHFFTSKRAAIQQGLSIAESYGQFGSSWVRGDFAPEIAHLQTMLQEWRPSAIVALGRTPFWALTGESALLTKVGQAFDCRLLTGIPVIPTFHPSFILRGNWGKQPEWLAHFGTAAQYVARK